MYMESTRRFGDQCVVGGPGVDRLQFARLRKAPDLDSLQPLLVMGRGEMQRSQSLSELYSNAAGLTCFLMDAADRAYRPQCIELLNLVYQGRDDDNSLLRLLNKDAAKLISEYHRFLTDVSDIEVAEFRDATNVCLRGTRVTGEGLAQLDVSKLQWLDVAGLPLHDQDLELLYNAHALRQLNLEATRITDTLFVSAPKQLAGIWPKLTELDLSQTRITDETVDRLVRLPLQVLWLTKTQATRQSVPQLSQMKRLTLLDLTGLDFGDADATRLKNSLPDLEYLEH